MNYIGSKFKLLSWIKEEIIKVVGNDLSDKIFCDLFAGTGAVGRAFKKDVQQIISNDLEEYSYILNRNYIENLNLPNNYLLIIDELNKLPLIDSGFIYKNYCLGSGSNRQYFSDYNGKKIDAIRTIIEEFNSNLTIDLYYFLLASLLESADKIANTASVYGAFLKSLKKSAQENLILQPAIFESNHQNKNNKVYKLDSNELIKNIAGDILYIDPPYNHRQYGANYHILNTIAIYDEFIPKGKTGMRIYNRSNYSKKGKVLNNFEELIINAKFKYIFLSYNNEGLMSLEDIKSVMKKYGKYDFVAKKYQRFKADKTDSRNHKAESTYEYLHILKK
jgi:adenine-specific DNA-methyltransferase